MNLIHGKSWFKYFILQNLCKRLGNILLMHIKAWYNAWASFPIFNILLLFYFGQYTNFESFKVWTIIIFQNIWTMPKKMVPLQSLWNFKTIEIGFIFFWCWNQELLNKTFNSFKKKRKREGDVAWRHQLMFFPKSRSSIPAISHTLLLPWFRRWHGYKG